MAGQATRRDGARSYVVCAGDRVVAYYSLCALQLERATMLDQDTVPAEVRFGAQPVPEILLARLTVDRGRQGSGLGRRLLIDASTIAATVADRVGARVLVVHALHDTAYLRVRTLRGGEMS